jgi:hypothetical protein
MKKTAIAFSVLVMSMMLATIAPAFAKNMHVPEGVSIDYYSGGECTVTLPSTWPAEPSGMMKGATIRIDVQHHEAGTYGAHDSMNIDVLGPTGKWLPLAYFTTSADPAFKNLIRAVYAGMPIGNFPTNLKVGLSENDLKVERHGNRIVAELTSPQSVLWPKQVPGFNTVTIPPFKLELDKEGGSLHWEEIHDFAKYSKYVIYEDNIGFSGTGAITCSTWNFVNQPLTDCDIIMHGISTIVPPPT